MSIQQPTSQQQSNLQMTEDPLIFPFSAINRASLPLVGGKAANLGELTRAGLPVPPGFCVTTAAYALVTQGANLEAILAELANTRADDATSLATGATAARTRLLAAPMPASVAESITAAYQVLGNGEPIAVAVRSSATAEDLPFASFAGQQDTYLNIVGIAAVLTAVQQCWASLWTDRAVSYRASNSIDPHTVRLAVAVQRMVDATVAGVLFTANPLTGRRRQAVIDASPGLGEAVVSGAVNPDHFVVNTTTGEILERRLGDKRLIIRATSGGGTQRIEQTARPNEACLSDQQIRALATLGAKVEAHYSTPQDTEWAFDNTNTLWLTQARPITTLYPLPPDAPTTDAILKVYFSFNVAQGVYRPFTPLSISMFRLMASSIATYLGFPPHDALVGPPFLSEAAQRLFFNLAPMLRTSLGRTFLERIMQVIEARTSVILQQLVADPRLSLIPPPRFTLIRTVLHVLVYSHAPLHFLQALLRPAAARARVQHLATQILLQSEVPANASAADRLAAIEQIFPSNAPRLFFSIIPVVLAAVAASMLARTLLGSLATADERQAVLRGLPYNPTTEMDVSLWALAQQIDADALAAQTVRETPPEQLAQDYLHGQLPPLLQQGLTDFLRTYGHRGIAEIDLGLPRWSEDPTHILGVLANYLQLTNPELAPDVQFRRGAQQAEAMVHELTRRAMRKSPLRGVLVGFCLRRVRTLSGLREMPKFYFVTLLARTRALLWLLGEELVQAGLLETATDIFFITIAEARAAMIGIDLRSVVRERRSNYEQELRRRHIPRILLSDGTEPTAESHTVGSTTDTLSGTPASAGIVTASARVILDPTGARLEPGEILVAPSTDPGWTPLFLTAGGLVMEMGGAMSHGAVVAREYGIPAVVGVAGATERIKTGQRITIDGSTGTITVEE